MEQQHGGENAQKLFEKLVNDFMIDKKTQQDISEMRRFYFDLIAKTKSPEHIKILNKLFSKQKLGKLAGLSEILIPKQYTTLTIEEILTLKKLGIEVAQTAKDAKLLKLRVEEVDIFKQNIKDRYKVNLISRLGKDEKIKEVPKSEYKTVKLKVSVMIEDDEEIRTSQIIRKKFDKLMKQIDKLYEKATLPEFQSRVVDLTKAIQEEAAKNLNKDFNYLTGEGLKKDVLPMPDTNSGLDNFISYGTGKIHDDAQSVIDLQKTGSLPSVYNEGSIDLIKNPQNIVIIVDTSGSTDTRNVYKLINIAANQARRFLLEKLGKKCNINVITYSSSVDNVLENINGFIRPDGGTSTQIALRAAIDYFEMRQTGHFTIGNLLSKSRSYQGMSFDTFDFLESMGVSDEQFQQLQKELEKKLTTITEHTKQAINNSHVILITDGLPNQYAPTYAVAELYKKLGLNFSQIVTAYPFPNVEKIIQGHLYRALGGDNIQDMEDYQKQFEAIAEAADGNSLVIWIDELLAKAIVDLTDLSIGLTHFKQLGLGDIDSHLDEIDEEN